MTQRGTPLDLALTTALLLLGFVPGTDLPRLRTCEELIEASRELETLSAKDGGHYPAQHIAADCAVALETLAARFRAAASQLQSTGEKTHES